MKMAGEVTPGDDGWEKWGTHVVLELQRLDKNVETLRDAVVDLKSDIKAMKTQLMIYGAIGGFIATAVVEVGIWWISTHMVG